MLKIEVQVLTFHTDSEFHSGFAQKRDFDDFPIFYFQIFRKTSSWGSTFLTLTSRPRADCGVMPTRLVQSCGVTCALPRGAAVPPSDYNMKDIHRIYNKYSKNVFLVDVISRFFGKKNIQENRQNRVFGQIHYEIRNQCEN